MNSTIEQSSNRAIKKQFTRRNTTKIILAVLAGLVFFYLITIPWRNYTYRSQMKKGADALAGRQYTLAYVYFQKAGVLKFGDKESAERQELAKKSAADILLLRDFLVDNNQADLLRLIDGANSKVCNLENDRTLVNNDLSQVAAVNLKFCAEEGPKDYDDWIFYGISQLKISENNYIFKELKPDYRAEAERAFEEAYKVDPIAKTAPEYLIELYKIDNNSEKVDYWQHLLDNLNKIEK